MTTDGAGGPHPPDGAGGDPAVNRRRVVVVDDPAMVREGVVGAIGSPVDVVAPAEDGDDAGAALASTRPDVV
ncbi:MAG: DNA-binding response regulator, partial [Acidimicrobiales bacterium]